MDGTVRAIKYSYDSLGRRTGLASYDSAAVSGSPPELTGNVPNEAALDFDDLSFPVAEYQAHAGAKDSNTPFVEYAHDGTAENSIYTKAMRPTYVACPNGRRVWTTYGSSGSVADLLSRPAAVQDRDEGKSGRGTGRLAGGGSGAAVAPPGLRQLGGRCRGLRCASPPATRLRAFCGSPPGRNRVPTCRDAIRVGFVR